MIDTHAHVDDSQFDTDREDVISRAFSSGVEKIINIGAGLGSSQRSVELAEEHENIFAVVGLHPHYFNQYREKSFDKIVELEKLLKNKKVVGIGEAGLDFHFHGEEENDAEELKEIQEKGFLYQIELAAKNNLPLVVHCREAYPETLQILKDAKKKYGEKLYGVIHSYLGRSSYAREFVELGFALSFNGIITFARDYDKVIQETDLENILLETDCPYLAPEPHRSKRNEPSYVKFVAEKIAEIKQISQKEVVKTTDGNARRIFKIS